MEIMTTMLVGWDIRQLLKGRQRHGPVKPQEHEVLLVFQVCDLDFVACFPLFDRFPAFHAPAWWVLENGFGYLRVGMMEHEKVERDDAGVAGWGASQLLQYSYKGGQCLEVGVDQVVPVHIRGPDTKCLRNFHRDDDVQMPTEGAAHMNGCHSKGSNSPSQSRNQPPLDHACTARGHTPAQSEKGKESINVISFVIGMQG